MEIHSKTRRKSSELVSKSGPGWPYSQYGLAGMYWRTQNPTKNKVFCIIMLKTLLKIMFFDTYKNHIKNHTTTSI